MRNFEQICLQYVLNIESFSVRKAAAVTDALCPVYELGWVSSRPFHDRPRVQPIVALFSSVIMSPKDEVSYARIPTADSSPLLVLYPYI